MVNRRRTIVGLMAASILIAGCGPRVPREELLAHWASERGPAQDLAPPSEAAAVAGVTATTPGTAPEASSPAGTPTTRASAVPAGAAPAAVLSKRASPIGAGPRDNPATGAATQSTPGASPAAPAGAASGGPGGTATPAKPAGCSSSLSPLVIGSVGQLSGIAGEAVTPQVKAVQAWNAATNAKGGINCHPIRYILADDGADPSRHQALVQQLVEQNKVIAFVNMGAIFTGQASVKYLNDKQVPVIGADGAESWFYESPMHFTQAPQGELVTRAMLAAAGDVARNENKRKLALLACVEAKTCSQLYDLGPGLASKYGMRMVYRGKFSIAQPDFTSHCQSAQSAGAQIVAILSDINSLKRLAKSCSTVNFKPVYAVGAQTADVNAPSDPLLDGLSMGASVLPWVVTSHAGVTEHTAVLKQYAPGLQPGPNTMVGWASAKLFELATKNLPEPPTSAGLLDGLWSIRNDDLGGITVPLTFTKGQPSPRTFCFWRLRIAGGRFVSPDNGARTCE